MPADPKLSERLRGLPQIQRLMETAEAERLCARFSRTALVEALRATLDEAREALRADAAPALDAAALVDAAGLRLAKARRPALRRVINATGVVLHTNLGRAPLPAAALEAMAEAGGGYCNLEFDMAAGGRGSRGSAIEPLLCAITGAEAGLAVNNAAVLIPRRVVDMTAVGMYFLQRRTRHQATRSAIRVLS